VAFTEDELLETIRKVLSGEAPGVRLGPGDDAALVEPSAHLGVLTADLLVEDVHFRRATIAPRDLGYKAMAVNVSDVAAMGGSPRFALVSLALPPDIEASWVVDVYGGLREAGDESAVAIVGGDLSRGPAVVVSVAVAGEVSSGWAITRAGAHPGDRIVVTGSLGAAAGGLMLSESAERRAVRIAGTTWGRGLLGAYFRPVARVGEGQTLAQAGAHAMMDLSDGLALDLSRLCRESEVGAVVHLADVPTAPGLHELAAAGFRVDPGALALFGGEDYELLAALPLDAVAPAREKLWERFGTPLTDIGQIRAEPGLLARDPEGGEVPLEPRGWDHFG
jgi:thiamine-monophosphate kinase